MANIDITFIGILVFQMFMWKRYRNLDIWRILQILADAGLK